jgi:hypothetical protein
MFSSWATILVSIFEIWAVLKVANVSLAVAILKVAISNQHIRLVL